LSFHLMYLETSADFLYRVCVINIQYDAKQTFIF